MVYFIIFLVLAVLVILLGIANLILKRYKSKHSEKGEKQE